MDEFTPTMNEEFRMYAGLRLRRHYLLLDEEDDSQEIAVVEEQMEALWEHFDAIQLQSLSGMGSDLNWIRRNCEPPPNGRKTPEDVSALDRQELEVAMKSKDWHRILHYMRLCAPSFRPASVARERGITYAAIGLPKYASVFEARAIQFGAARAVSEVETLDTGFLTRKSG